MSCYGFPVGTQVFTIAYIGGITAAFSAIGKRVA